MRWRATVAYDGTAYQGFQRQPGEAPTIQAELERAIGQVAKAPVRVIGAGRTDTGVHATGQVIAFDVLAWRHDAATLLRAVNAALARDVALQTLEPAAAAFHPRYDALSRLYRYRVLVAPERQPLLRDRVWRVNTPLNGGALAEAAALLLGKHDFASFGKPPRGGDNTVRTIVQSAWTMSQSPEGTLWTYTVEADAFLQHMVRRMTALLVKTGQERLPLTEFERLFRRAILLEGLIMAPPQGLTLEAVRYPS